MHFTNCNTNLFMRRKNRPLILKRGNWKLEKPSAKLSPVAAFPSLLSVFLAPFCLDVERREGSAVSRLERGVFLSQDFDIGASIASCRRKGTGKCIRIRSAGPGEDEGFYPLVKHGGFTTLLYQTIQT